LSNIIDVKILIIKYPPIAIPIAEAKSVKGICSPPECPIFAIGIMTKMKNNNKPVQVI
jgi:hypothetical protein